MRKGLTISLIITMLAVLVLSIWLAKLIWFKPFNIDLYFERVYIEFLWEDPEALTQTGVLDPFGLKGHRSELTLISPAETRRMAEVGKRNLKLIKEYDRKKLKGQQLISYDILLWFLQTGVDAEPFLFHDYPITHISGAHLEIPQFLNSLPIETKNDISDFQSRLHQVDEKFGSVIDALEARRKLGIIPPTHILAKSISFCDEVCSTPASENSIYLSFERKMNGIALLDPNLRETHLEECEQTIRDEVIPAYKRLSRYLFQLQRSSLSIAGVWQLPDGRAYYKSCLLQQTSLNLDPDTLYDIGKQEMYRLNGELTILLNLVGKASDPDLITSLNHLSSSKAFKTDSIGRAKTLAHFKTSSGAMSGLVSSYFNQIPSKELDVLELPERRSENSTFAFYLPPRGEPLSNGRLYVNTWKADGLYPQLARIYAYHEGIPGHHLQKGIQADLIDLPTFRRFLPFEAYTEGWAMYAEKLGVEMSGSKDVLDHIALLQSDLFRTTRMMTDIGIHHKMWLREQAIEFMTKNAGLSEASATEEVDRYIVWPGQGCAYKVGQMKFFELRKLAEQELGEKFDLKEFHDVLISDGAMPLQILEERVNTYLTEKKR